MDSLLPFGLGAEDSAVDVTMPSNTIPSAAMQIIAMSQSKATATSRGGGVDYGSKDKGGEKEG